MISNVYFLFPSPIFYLCFLAVLGIQVVRVMVKSTINSSRTSWLRPVAGLVSFTRLTLDKLVSISAPPLPYLQNRDNISYLHDKLTHP